MGDRSLIEWLGDPYLNTVGMTWNLWWGCDRVSDECDFCYIERTPPLRMRHLFFDKPGIGGKTGIVYAERRVLFYPLRKTTPLLVFPESLGDLWHQQVDDVRKAEMIAVMLLANWHIYQCTTKRTRQQMLALTSELFADLVADAVDRVAAEAPQYGARVRPADLARARSHMAERLPGGAMRPLSNMWIGTTVGSPQAAKTRLPYLRRTPAEVRWLSAEPVTSDKLTLDGQLADVHHVVLGGESGDKSKVHAPDTGPGTRLRRLEPEHLDVLIDEVRDQGTTAFVKQLGTPWAVLTGARHPKGGDWTEWPPHLRVREYPRQLAERALRYNPTNERALAAVAS